jgi:hypothetical protein
VGETEPLRHGADVTRLVVECNIVRSLGSSIYSTASLREGSSGWNRARERVAATNPVVGPGRSGGEMETCGCVG